MNLQQQTKFVDDFLSRMKEVMIGKGNDYANEDRLSNFKLAGSICGLTPEQNCLSMIATKVARLGVLLGGKEPSNESIDDSLLDLANYAVLLACLRQEKEIEAILKDYVDEDEPQTVAPAGYSKPTIHDRCRNDNRNGSAFVPKDLTPNENSPVWSENRGINLFGGPQDITPNENPPVPNIDTPIYDDELVKVGNEDR